MWFRRRPRFPIFLWLLALFGIARIARRRPWSDMPEERRESYRKKRHQFIQKLDDAYRVWDEPDETDMGDPEQD